MLNTWLTITRAICLWWIHNDFASHHTATLHHHSSPMYFVLVGTGMVRVSAVLQIAMFVGGTIAAFVYPGAWPLGVVGLIITAALVSQPRQHTQPHSICVLCRQAGLSHVCCGSMLRPGQCCVVLCNAVLLHPMGWCMKGVDCMCMLSGMQSPPHGCLLSCLQSDMLQWLLAHRHHSGSQTR